MRGKKMNGKDDLSQEDKDKMKKVDEVFKMAGKPILKRVSEISGRDLTDEEKEKISFDLKAFYTFSTLLLGTTL